MSDIPLSDTPVTPSTDPPKMVDHRALEQERRERQALAAKLAEVEAVAAAHAADAERWRTHSAAEAKRLDEQNAAGLAALPESARAAFGSLDRNALAAALQVFGDLRAAATPPPADPAPPKHPVGGGVQLGAVDAASTLTIPEREWKASQPALARTSDEQVKHLFKLAHPKR